jgi:uncharacterized protein YukE
MAGTATLPTKSLLPLASFARNWVGGDIHGLAAFAGTLYGYVPAMEDVVTALNKKVSQTVTDASWQGTAAQAFTGNWEQVSAEVNAVGLVVIGTGSIVDQLAANLAEIENALENAAAQAAAHGVQVGADGQPPGVCYGNATQEEWRVSYGTFYQQCMAEANDARVQAAGALVQLTSAITSGRAGTAGGSGDVGVAVGEGNTIADLFADLLATPTAYSFKVADKVAEAEENLTKAQDALHAAEEAAQQADAWFGVAPRNVKAAQVAAEGELDSVKAELTRARSGENAISELFATRERDLPGLSKLADGLDNSSLLFKALDLPVVDVVAGGISTVLNAQQDVHAGVSGWFAYPLETVNTVGSIALATVVGTAVGGAAIFAGAPALGVAAGVTAGALVAYGVGDYVHNYIADILPQVHEHGVLLGIGTDFGAAGVSTWDDTTHLASDVGGLASGAWHGVTSLF